MSGLGGRCLLRRALHKPQFVLLRTTELSVSVLPLALDLFGAFGQGLLGGRG